MILAQILSIATQVHASMGSETGKAVLDFLAARYALTPEQHGNLDSNYRDYVERIARLQAEVS